MGLAHAVERTIRRHAMLAGGETVLVAVSGGADSVALLHILRELAPTFRLTLHVLHVDHGLRADSVRDAEFVRALGARLGVPVEVERVAVGPGSVEAAARDARYAALEAWADRLGADRIAIGHSADDQAETVLMRLLDGAGVRGLAGIPPRRGRVIRPLIETRRQALRDALVAAGLDWVEDETNRDPKFLRNRIRHELLPLLAASYATDVVPSLARAARRARETVDALDRTATDALERLASGGGRRADAAARGARDAASAAGGRDRCARPPRASAAAPRSARGRTGDCARPGPGPAPPPVPTRRRHGGGERRSRPGGRRPRRRHWRRGRSSCRVVSTCRRSAGRCEARILPATGYALPRTADCVAFDAARRAARDPRAPAPCGRSLRGVRRRRAPR